MNLNIQGPLTGTATSFAGSSGISFDKIYNTNTVSSTALYNTTYGIIVLMAFTVLAQGATIQLGGITWTGTATAVDVIIINAGNP
jgi:hypothetical protein